MSHEVFSLKPAVASTEVVIPGAINLQRLPACKRAALTIYITQHIDSPIRSSDLAALTKLSVSQFCRLFKATFGLSAHRYVTHVRLAHAEHLMRSTALPLTEIALATGMCDQSHFCHVFRKKFGESPSSWRRSQAAA